MAFLFSLYAIIWPESISNSFISTSARYWVVVLGLFIAHEILIRELIVRAMTDGRQLHPAVRYVNAFVEVSVPTVALVIEATLELSP